MLKRSPGSQVYCVPSSTIELPQGFFATCDSLAERGCLSRGKEQYGFTVIGAALPLPFATSSSCLHWVGTYGVRTQPHTLRSFCLSQVAMQCKTPPRMVMAPMTGATLTPSGMVMLLIPRVAVTPLSDEGHSGKVP